tara:strand:- start:257 stop:448 length:192 start_codon:yes stop_codon:yes gene_type:complete
MPYIIRVYKDVEMETDDKNQAIEMATDCLSDFDTEIIQETNKPKTTEEHFDQCLRKWGGNGKR